MPEQVNHSLANVTPEQKGAALRTSLAAHLGILFGAVATLSGGAVGALSSKVIKKYSPAKGFASGAIFIGGVTSVIQLINWSRLGNAAAHLPMEAIALNPELPASDDLKMPEQREKKSHVDSIGQTRSEQSGLTR